ncbi:MULTISPECIES: hypothetical protein [Streptomyces]|uniref:Uncharacterized protein n=1 Tax=Streptomyces lonegramiae TaxID=3075524 RepID=A0ABU2XEZ0_9ACTN|nr:hypothetical protein [Streptomyces sp. DSM 41529]MDT0544489.1 hypothetical protein [Streptomyces sp. DSM 41529]
MPGDRPTMPPVRLRSEAELARDALAAPLLARAVRLARWAGPRRAVAAGGVLTEPDLRAAAEHLGLGADEEGPGYAAEAWQLAVDTGLIEVQEPAAETGDADADAGPEPGEDGVTGIATPGEDLRLITEGSPRDILDIWLGGFETVLADAAAPDLAEIVEQIGDDGELDLDAIDWDPEEEADFLDGVLGNLYLLTALDEEDSGRAVPLPALAAAMIVPDDMEEPTDDILEEISEAMVRLDDQFRMLEPTGLVEYQPVDEALIEEVDGEGRFPETTESRLDPDEDDVSRYGMVRLTPLGVFGVRSRMLDAGIGAPVVGDLADKGAEILLDALPGHPETAARAEAEQWLARRTPDQAAGELLAAARGDDEGAPLRRLACQQTLSLVGPAAEPALREVLDDRHLGGLARVWLAERAMPEIPEPSEEMVFWLTVDTIAAQLAADGDSAELRDLVRGLVEQSETFFDSVWRVDHPATAEVLEAMGRLHPDKQAAKQARKAAFKARSRA